MGDLTEAFSKSIDYQVFSDFMIDGSEKDYRQDKILEANANYAGQAKNEDDDNAVDRFRDGVELLDRQREAQQEKMREFNGVQYTDADLDATINDILNDKDAFAAKHDLSDSEMDRAEYYAMVMVNMTPEERDEYLNGLEGDDPSVAGALADDLEARVTERENMLEQKDLASTSLQADEVAAELSSSADQYVHTDGASAPFTFDM